jgi:tRNA(fMet)-specific endonuclease VapC
MSKTEENLTLIDTDILIFILKNHETAVKNSIKYQQNIGALNISELTYYECLRGYESTGSFKKLLIFKQLIERINVHPLNKEIYEKASEVYAKLREIGYPSGEFDILIASTALVKQFKLVTNNTKHYQKIKEYFGLELINWIE